MKHFLNYWVLVYCRGPSESSPPAPSFFPSFTSQTETWWWVSAVTSVSFKKSVMFGTMEEVHLIEYNPEEMKKRVVKLRIGGSVGWKKYRAINCNVYMVLGSMSARGRNTRDDFLTSLYLCLFKKYQYEWGLEFVQELWLWKDIWLQF